MNWFSLSRVLGVSLTLAFLLIAPMSTLAQEPTPKGGEAKADATVEEPKKDPLSPEGIWKTIDDATNKPRSLVKIWLHDGKLFARVTKLYLREGEPENPTCEECKGRLKGQPIKGLRIVSGLTKDGDEWSGGQILDPESGKVYKVFMEVQDGGKKIKVRGFVGVAMFGRTQYWHRVK